MSQEFKKLSLILFLLFSATVYSQKSTLEMKVIGKIVDDKLKIELKNISEDTLIVLGNLYLDSRVYLGLKKSGLDYTYIKDCKEENTVITTQIAQRPSNYGEFDDKSIILTPNSSQEIIVWFVGGERVCRNVEKNKLKITYKVELSDDFSKIYETEKSNFSKKINDFEKQFSTLKSKSSENDLHKLSNLLNDLIRRKKIIEGFENLKKMASQNIEAETEYIQF